jgi:hypothetical protein
VPEEKRKLVYQTYEEEFYKLFGPETADPVSFEILVVVAQK